MLVEVRLKPSSPALSDSIKKSVKKFLAGYVQALILPSTVTGWSTYPDLANNIDLLRITESTCTSNSVPFSQAELEIHVYQPTDGDAFEEFATSKTDGEEVVAASVCELPCRNWDGLWDTLVYSDDIKPRLLNYIHATLVFSERDVDFNVVSWNRVVLLHGPPGTGKTSLCRALAQKLAIRLSERYPAAKLVEINSHSLFSRWFSESGKLVQRLFASVTEMIEEEGTFVVLLIDEVESLTAARAGAMSGNEPSDALRVVNALLTQLDKLKHRKNVLVMTTSNLVDAIDAAFIDRADIVQYVGLPPQEAIYGIIQSCINELIRAKIIAPVLRFSNPLTWQTILEASEAELQLLAPNHPRYDERTLRASHRLWELAGKCKGMSGRTLRRLPVLAHARHIGASASLGSRASGIEVWLDAMVKVVEEESNERVKKPSSV
ncbi:hypothetical protein M407DRAFT_69382 [Tulasnella calospora MUT 4182]|uniref:AAA+ ATPase domain-containing protein n=1 Tax=Tulasnella calospora MUT 4182 TaxID=1051891 RepID=A0A0C3QPI9_9AGAM|nr:hypothetical protein M407DRAFT_69382 [Tulasnella calospora MUT 4182]